MANASHSPNRLILLEVAEVVAPLLTDLVFVGGQVAELLITSPGATRIRPTDDVDVVVGATTRLEYHRVESRLAELGLRNDSEGPICRWHTPMGGKLDVMPSDRSVLGFGSRWYDPIIENAVPYPLSDRITILVPTAPLFLASKWDAFLGRGEGDYVGSHDLEDIISVVAGRAELHGEIVASGDEVKQWLAERARDFLEADDAAYAIQGALPDVASIPELLDEVTRRFDSMASV